MKSYVIDTSALQENLRILRQAAHNTVIWGVIKGNGYGLGCTRMAQCLYKQGICHFAVTELQEARGLRQAGFTGTPILILENFCQRSQLAELVDLDCILTVGSAEDARQISKLGLERGMPVPVHVKIDTGMGRYGFLPEQLEQILELYTGYPGLSPEGIYTHFSDAGNPAVTQRQFERFRQVVSAIRSQGHLPGMVHCCNSTAFWNYPHMHLDGVRIGSALLGRVPWAEEAGPPYVIISIRQKNSTPHS